MAGRINYYGNVVSNGLIMDLDAAKFDSYPKTGTRWYDITWTTSGGTLTNGPVFNSSNGGFFSFDGVDDLVNLGNQSFNTVTFDLWVNIQTFTGNRAILSKGSQALGSGATFAAWIVSATNTVRNRFYNFSGNSAFVTTASLTSNVWYNLTWTYDNSNVRLYTNSSLTETSAVVGPLIVTNNTNLLIASDFYTQSAEMRSSGFKMYNRALTQAEITQNYNAVKGRFGL
ncbi:Concanavalin A-like lectin/glucanases superfamily [uncultured Caudovirales phage]|uniref:Concanavalin A-like lectin/glucanases superfamily n=1 Tax=uncultured Caudovirales phage TaxID=2100421 RepID=A0A6J5L5N3_9CAUD|nr:Concanavalin A-like lectin/glucanases superfamily [uncultured Caudovirales phage]